MELRPPVTLLEDRTPKFIDYRLGVSMIRRGLFFVCALALPLVADEGLWLFNQFPKDAVAKKYGFDVTDAFLAHIQLASMRLSSGSGSFVTARGLVFTNHHVGRECVQDLSTGERDYIRNGFYARATAEERPCPDFELNVLERVEDVTAQVQAAVDANNALPAGDFAANLQYQRCPGILSA